VFKKAERGEEEQGNGNILLAYFGKI